MDCDKFDQHVMDALYGELDELTFEALKRHVEGCPRCGPVWAGLKSARAAAALPLEEPPSGLESRILAAEKTVHRHAPWHRKIMRAAAWAGSHAMRPQLAMAALFLFVIGSSLLLLRGRPGAPVQVSEQGRPAPRADAPQPTKPAAQEVAGRQAAPGAKGFASEEKDGAARAGDARTEAMATAAGAPPPVAAQASAAADEVSGDAEGLLAEGRLAKQKNGCDAAIPKFQGVIQGHPNTPASKVAQNEIDACRTPSATASASSAPGSGADAGPPR